MSGVDSLNAITLVVIVAIIILVLLASIIVVGTLRPDLRRISGAILPVSILLVFVLSVALGYFGLFVAIALLFFMLFISHRYR